MGEVDLFEKLIAGTLGTTAVLGFAAWLLWQRLNAREASHEAAMERKDAVVTTVVEKVSTAMGDLKRSVDANTSATIELRSAIEQREEARDERRDRHDRGEMGRP